MDLRSHCPVNYALEHFGDKWSLLIIRDLMFKEKRHYNEFLSCEEGVSTSVLGDRLKQLETNGIISKGKDNIKKSRIRYSLTRKGISMLPIMVDIILWSYTHDDKTDTHESFVMEYKANPHKYLADKEKELMDSHLKENGN